MVTYLSKSDASEGFNQIIDFLNRSFIKYALTVNPNVYVSCIKQFWTTVAVKQVNDVTRLQALVDMKKEVVTEATIRECMSAKRTSCNEFSSSMASAVICLSTVTQKVFANMRRVGKGFSRIETPLFEGMMVEQEIYKEGDVDEHVEEVNTKRDDSAAHGDVYIVAEEQSIPSPPLPTLPPQPPQDISSTSQGRMIAEMDQYDAVVLEDDKAEDKDVADAVKDAEEAKVIETNHKVVIAASETVTAASAIITTAEAQVRAATTATLTAAPVRVTAAPSRRRKGVIIRDHEEESTTSTIIPTKTKSKDKHKGILNEAIDHVKLKAKEDPAVKRYQVLKRKPQTEAQARKNMMIYLKNVAGFKLDYFKGMSYDDIRIIFEAKFNSNVDLLLKTKEQIEEEENRALQTINETPAEKAAKRRKLNEEVEDLKRNLRIMPNENDDVYTEATPLARKVPVVDYEIIEMNNKPYYKIIRADGTHQLYISFLTLLRNFDREDLEALWSLVKERFSTSKPKNFSDDFLLTTLGAMFEKPDAHAQI
nr:hypothetical protein [Tanacetum cinerariifolium]